MKIVDINAAEKPRRRLKALDYIDTLGFIIEEWRVKCVEPGSEEYDAVYWALRALGCRRIALGRGCYVSLDALGVYDDFEEKPRGEVYYSVLDMLERGRPTPLVRLRWRPTRGVRVWAKLEWFNPLSLSVKDRPAFHIVREEGLGKGDYVGDASSSNFAAALSALGALLGFKARLYLPASTGKLGKIASLLYGAEVVVDESAKATTDLLKRVVADASRLGFTHVNQFTNDLNFESHIKGTAREIDYQSRIAGFNVAGVAGSLGTSGHMAAVAFYFTKKSRSSVDVVLAQPAEGSIIPGLRRIETGMLWINLLDIDYNLYDVTLSEALETAEEVARSDGILVSPSGGAALAAIRRHAERGLASGDYVVVIPDTGYKYLDLFESWKEGGGLREGESTHSS